MGVQVRVTSKVDQSALRAFIVNEVGRGVQRASGRVRDLAKAEITAAGRVDTGQMRNGVVAEAVRVEGNRVVGRVVATAAHSAFQHEGTANDGQGFIYPRRARVLRFRPRGSGRFVFTPRVRGVKGVPFLTIALDKVNASDFT